MEIYSPRKKSKELFKLNKFQSVVMDEEKNEFEKNESIKIKFEKSKQNNFKKNKLPANQSVQTKSERKSRLGNYLFNLIKGFFEYEEVL